MHGISPCAGKLSERVQCLIGELSHDLRFLAVRKLGSHERSKIRPLFMQGIESGGSLGRLQTLGCRMGGRRGQCSFRTRSLGGRVH